MLVCLDFVFMCLYVFQNRFPILLLSIVPLRHFIQIRNLALLLASIPSDRTFSLLALSATTMTDKNASVTIAAATAVAVAGISAIWIWKKRSES